jgi:hypothetical protein
MSPAAQVIPDYPSPLLDSLRNGGQDLTQLEVEDYAVRSLVEAIEGRRLNR